MAESNRQDNDERQAEIGKKLYDAPRVLFKEELEANALLCSPSPPGKAVSVACPLGPINS